MSFSDYYKKHKEEEQTKSSGFSDYYKKRKGIVQEVETPAMDSLFDNTGSMPVNQEAYDKASKLLQAKKDSEAKKDSHIISDYVPNSSFGMTKSEYDKRRKANPDMPEFGSYGYFVEREKALKLMVDEIANDAEHNDETYRAWADNYARDNTWMQGKPVHEKAKSLYEKFQRQNAILAEYSAIHKQLEEFGVQGIHYDDSLEIDAKSGAEEAKYAADRLSAILGATPLTNEEAFLGLYETAPEEKQANYDKYKAIAGQAAIEASKEKAYEYYDKNKDKVYDDNLVGRVLGNSKLGRIGIESNKAGFTSFVASSEDIEASEVYQLLSDRIQRVNEETFRNNTGFDNTVATISQYIPQGIDQFVLGTAGRLAGGQFGSAIASSTYMYEQTAGASFVRLLQETDLDVEDAKKLATSEALASGAVEFGLDFVTSGLWKGGSALTKGVTSKAGNAFLKKLTDIGISERGARIILDTAKNAGRLAMESTGEGAEEWLQEGISITADKYADAENAPSALELFLKSLDISQYSSEEIARMKEAGIGGATIGFAMGGGNAAVSSVQSHFDPNRQIGATIRKNDTVDKILDMASVPFSPEEATAYEAYKEYAESGISASNARDIEIGDLAVKLERDLASVINSDNTSGDQKTAALSLLRDLEAYKQNKSISRLGKGKVKKVYGDAEHIEALIAEGLESGEGTKAYELATEYKAKVDSGKKLSAAEITRLVDATDAAVKSETEKAVSERLTELGETGDVEKLSDIIARKESGELLTSAEQKMLEESEFGSRVAEEVTASDEELSEASVGLSEDEATLFRENYSGGDVESYRASFDLVSELAKNNYGADYILENKGVLSPRQVQNIYSKVVTEPRMASQRALDGLVSKYEGRLTYKSRVDDSVFDGVKGEKLWKSLNKRQKQAITFAKAFAKGAGINLKITYGEKYNGYYDPATNSIVIDARAGFDRRYKAEDAIIPTMSHELTHWAKQKAPELYAELSRKIFGIFKDKGLSEDGLIEDEQRMHPEYTDDQARDEIIARACEDLFSMSESGREIFNSLSENEQKTLTEKIKEIIKNLVDWVNELLGLYESKSDEAGILRGYKEKLSEAAKLWDEMFASAVRVNAALEAEGVFGNLENGISEDGTTIVGKSDLQMSEKTYREGGRAFLVDWLENQSGLDEKDIADIVNQTDRIASLMRAIREGNDLPGYAAWADMEVVKNENGEPMSVIVKNGDYKMNIDFSQVCKKRVALDAVLNAMVKSGDLSVYTLTETDVAMLNDIIKRHDFEIACALCFVDSKRYRVGAWAESFCEGMDEGKGKKKVHKYGFNEMLRSLVPEGSKIQIDEFNFTGRDIADNPTKNLLSEADDSELDFSLIDRIMAENDPKSAQHRYAKAIKENPSIRKILNPSEIISSVGLDKIRLEAPAVYALINGHQGTAKPKFAHSGVAYGNNILQASNFTPEAAKMVGGVRCQSFSDFMANMIVDYAQFISELAAKGLTSHSYTKEPLFVKLFGLTGMKINMSLVPRAIDMTPEQRERFKILKEEKPNKRSKAYKAAKAEYDALAENAGLDENGEYIWEDETFPYDIAMEIVEDRRYSANCGTIAVGISDKHILKLLADERISMVIPYHKSSLNHQVAMMRDIALYKDYTGVQNTRDRATGKKLDKDNGQVDFDFYGDLYGVNGKKGTHDPKKTAKNYLLWCKANNYIPKFDRFAGDENYYKLLIDFRVYDVDGTYVEQQPVKAIYPENDEFQDLILNGVKDKDGKVYGGLRQQQETSDRLARETKEIVEEYRRELAEKYGQDVLGEGVQKSEKDTGVSAYDIMGKQKELEKRYKILEKDFARLKEMYKLDKRLTHGKVLDPKQVEAVARYLVKYADSDYKASELAPMLNDLYVDIREIVMTNPDATWEELYSKAYEVAKEIRTRAKVKVERPAYYEKILKEIRSARIAPNEGQKGDARYRFGDHYIGKFRGRVIIANDGTPLDIKWSEWANKYPKVFDKDISDAQQLVELYDIYDDLRNAEEVVVDYTESEMMSSLTEEIINKAWGIDNYESMADKGARMAQEQRLADDIYYGGMLTKEKRKAQERIKELRAEHRKAMQEMRETYKQKESDRKLLDNMYYGRLFAEMKTKRIEDVARAKQAGREKLAEYRENAERKRVIETITGDCLRLNKMLVTNSKDLHIHEALKGPVMELLDAIDFSSKRMLDKGIPTRKDISLEAALTKVKDMMKDASDGDLDLVHLYGHNLDEDIKKMMESVTTIRRSFADNEFVLQQMSLDDLLTLKKIVKTIKSAVNKLNEFHVVQHARGIAHLSQESVEYLDSLGRGKVFDGAIGNLSKAMVWNNTLPYYAFKRYGEGGTLVYEALMDGWDRFAFNIDKIMRFTQSVYTDKEVDTWDAEVKTFKIAVPATEAQLADPEYKPKFQEVQMTVSQIMSLYCLQKREQAHKHLLEGGIRVDNFKKKNGEIITQEDGAVLTAKDIESIVSSLSARQKAVADKLQEFLNTVCSDWGNEVSMARFGIKQFGEVHYFPIKSDDANITQDEAKEEADSFFKLLGASFAKGLTEGANNRIVIGNIFDVFAKHTSDMAKYNALALPVLDAFRWYNYKGKQAVGDEGAFISYSLKQSMKRAFGDDGLKYFTQFLKDINGTKTVSRDTLGGGFIKNDKIASVGANLRVIFLQPTSYVRASAVIDNKYLTKALAFKDKARGKAVDMAEKYCGIALWKSLGYYDTNVQQGVTDQIKHRSNWHDRATDLSMKGASMADRLTWGLLWNACELEIRDKRKDLKVGSEEFYKAIGKRLRDVIYATQVVDSTMTRSQLMRSGDKQDKLTTSFMSEPTLSYNMVLDAVMDVRLESRRSNFKEAWKKYGWKVARTAYAYTMTNALAALVETAFDAYRDDDDEEKDLLEYVKRYFANFAEDMSIVGKIPILKDLLSIIQGYGASYSILAGFEGLFKAVTQWWKIFTTDKGNPATALKNTLKGLSSISGLPIYNVYRDTAAGLDKFFGADIEELLNDLID